MELSIMFNWPPGKNFARVSFGIANIKDEKCLFRAGIIKREETDKIYQTDWVAYDKIRQFEHDIKRGDKIVVEKKQDKKIIKNIFDTNKERPVNAQNNTHVDRKWIF